MPQSSTHKKHHAFFVRQRLIVDASELKLSIVYGKESKRRGFESRQHFVQECVKGQVSDITPINK
jgi:hypothetical protein